MKDKMINFIKKHLVVSAIVSVIVSVILFFLKIDGFSWIENVLIGLSAFGVYSLVVVLISIYFPKLVIKDYADVEDYVTVYFYEGYNNGLSRVIQLYGNPNDSDDMEKRYSFINLEGKYITDKWFYDTGTFKDNRVVVCIEPNQFNIMNEKGEMVCDENYPGMSDEIVGGFVKVSDGKGGINFVDVQTGKELWPRYKLEMTAQV